MSVFILLLVQTLYQTVIHNSSIYFYVNAILTVGREKISSELHHVNVRHLPRQYMPYKRSDKFCSLKEITINKLSVFFISVVLVMDRLVAALFTVEGNVKQKTVERLLKMLKLGFG